MQSACDVKIQSRWLSTRFYSEDILITKKIWSTGGTQTGKFGDFLSFRKHGDSAGPRGVLSTRAGIKSKITNFHGEKLPSRNTSDVSSPVYGGEKVGRVSQRGRRYLHVAYVSIRLLCGTFGVGHSRSNREKLSGVDSRRMIQSRFHSANDRTFTEQNLITL